MGRKPNTKPLPNLHLYPGSLVHWDQWQVIDNGNSTAFMVTCGICGKDRWVRRISIRHSDAFSGLCRKCSCSLRTPPRPQPGGGRSHTRSISKSGYVTLAIGGLSPEDQLLCKGIKGMEQTQNGNRAGRVLEHRLVMARKLGRPLLPSETVHHLREPKDDNRPENLELRVGRHGKGFAKHDLLVEIDRLKLILDEHNIPY